MLRSVLRRLSTAAVQSAGAEAASAAKAPFVAVRHAGVPSGSAKVTFAVFECNGKQMKAVPGDIIMADRLSPDLDLDQPLLFDKVLLIGNAEKTVIGLPHIPEAKVHAVVEEQTKLGKIIVFKKKRKTGYKRTKGHRADVTVFRVTGIEFSGEDIDSKEAPEPAADLEFAVPEDGQQVLVKQQ